MAGAVPIELWLLDSDQGPLLLRDQDHKHTLSKPSTNPKPETRDPEPVTRTLTPGPQDPEYKTRNPKPETRNPEPENRTSKTEPRKPGYENRNPFPCGIRSPSFLDTESLHRMQSEDRVDGTGHLQTLYPASYTLQGYLAHKKLHPPRTLQ